MKRINHHHLSAVEIANTNLRVYEAHGSRWTLTRDAKGRYTLRRAPRRGDTSVVNVRGEAIWGEGWDWKRAARVASAAVNEWRNNDGS